MIIQNQNKTEIKEFYKANMLNRQYRLGLQLLTNIIQETRIGKKIIYLAIIHHQNDCI